MKKLVYSLAMLASLSTFAISPIKNSSKKIKNCHVFNGEGIYSVSCGSVNATFEACSSSEAASIANRICPGCNEINVIRNPKSIVAG